MTLPKALITLSAAVFALIGLAYMIAPALMLSVVAIDSTPTSAFLLRTIGVALLCAGGFLWAVRDSSGRQLRLVLTALGGYYVLSSVVDLSAYSESVVGMAAVPSVIIRFAVGGICLIVATRLT